MFPAGVGNVNSVRPFMLTIGALAGAMLREAVARLLPPTCRLCGMAGSATALDLCGYCRELLPPNPGSPSERLPGFARVVVPLRYAYPVDHFIRALKFGGDRVYARILGDLLAEEIIRLGGPMPAALVPVPLHSSRYRSRGFNQAAEIARFAGRGLGIRVDSSCLGRAFATAEQSALPRLERRRNVRGAFEVLRAPVSGHIALVDDVLTTGSTATQAGRALLAAADIRLELWAAARVVLQ
jgi:ComF family protein